MTTAAISSAALTKGFPSDLRHWAGECRVIQLALEAAQEATERCTLPVSPAGAHLNSRMMLTLLTYAYAIEIYESAEIEWAARHEPAVKYICAGSTPETFAIRRFRRANRQTIERCLAVVIAGVRKQRRAELEPFQAGDAAMEAESYGEILQAVQRKLQLAILMDAANAD